MRRKISLHEAKSKFSALVRRVREGDTAVITVRGEAAAELRPVMEVHAETLEDRVRELDAAGLLSSTTRQPSEYPEILKVGRVSARPSALKRFLADRE